MIFLLIFRLSPHGDTLEGHSTHVSVSRLESAACVHAELFSSTEVGVETKTQNITPD